MGLDYQMTEVYVNRWKGRPLLPAISYFVLGRKSEPPNHFKQSLIRALAHPQCSIVPSSDSTPSVHAVYISGVLAYYHICYWHWLYDVSIWEKAGVLEIIINNMFTLNTQPKAADWLPQSESQAAKDIPRARAHE